MKLLLALLFLSSSVYAIPPAQQPIRKSVVKLESRAVGNPQIWKGSAMLFENQGTVYAITSDHVVLHGNEMGSGQKIEHTLWNKDVGLLNAEYLVSDWGAGLALLKVPSMKPFTGMASLQELNAIPAEDAPVRAYGFPFNSQVLLGDIASKFFAWREVQIFASNKKVMEITASYGEFGMSGGPVFTDDWKFSGLLSHLVFSLPQKGNPSKEQIPAAGIWDPLTVVPDNSLLAIPAPFILDWLNRYFQNPSQFQVYFFQPPFRQLESLSFPDMEQIYTGPVHLSSGNKGILFFVESRPRSALYPDPSGFFQSLVTMQTAKITDSGRIFFRQRSADCPKDRCWRGSWRIRKFNQLISSLNDPGYEPIAQISSPINYDLEKLSKAFSETGKILQSALGSFRCEKTDQNCLELEQIFEDLVEMTITDWMDPFLHYKSNPPEPAWTALRAADIEFLLSSPTYKPRWAEFDKKYPSYVIRKALEKLRDLMAQNIP